MTLLHEVGTASETGTASVVTAAALDGRTATNLGTDPMGRVNDNVGWKKSMCACSDAGMEYWSVRMLVDPVSTWVNTENSAERSSLACETGMLISSMSPAGVTGLAAMLFSASHSDTAARLSSVGFTNAATSSGVKC